MLLAAAFLYVYTCGGTILKLDAKSGKGTGHWQISQQLPKELAIDAKDGCLLNSVQYDEHSKKLLAVIPKEPAMDAQGKRSHKVVAFELPSMRYGGSLDIPLATGAVPEIGPLGRVEFELSADERYEMLADSTRQPLRWLGDARKRPAEKPVIDPAHQLAAKLSLGQHLARIGMDGKQILVAQKSGKVAVHDAVSGKVLAEGLAPPDGRFVCLAPGGKVAMYVVRNRLQVVPIPGKGARPVFADVAVDATAACVGAPR